VTDAPQTTKNRLKTAGYRKSFGERLFDAFNVTLLCVLMFLTFYPFYYVFVASLSDATELARHQGLLIWPAGFSFDAYARVLENPRIRTGYLNTLIYVIGGVAVKLALTCLGAYALSRRGLALQGPIMFMIIFTMFFSGGLIPTYLLVRDLGLVDTRWAMILPGAISVWNLIVLRTAFQAVPYSLEESAKIDGANDFTILWRIYLPLALPAVAVIGLFYAVGQWNTYFDALIYLSDRDLHPLQLVLREILMASSTEEMMTGVVQDRVALEASIKYATIIVSILPIVTVYPFLQRYFIKGVLIGSLKG